MRFEVTLILSGGGEARKHVLTWLGPEKAITLAVEEHTGNGEAARIYDVRAAEIGPAPRTPDGTVDVGRDLHDRFEF